MEDILKHVKDIEEKYGKKVLNINEVADYLGIDTDSIKELVASNDIKAIGSGEKMLFKSMHIVKFALDIKDEVPTNMITASTKKESKAVKVSRGSIYKVNSNKNPLEMAFVVTFDNGESKRLKVRGRSNEELEHNKELKIKEIINEHNRQEICYEGIKIEEDKHITFSEVADEWYAEFVVDQQCKGNSYSNIENAMYMIRVLKRVIGDIDIKDIDDNMAKKIMLNISYDEDKQNYKSKSYVDKALQKFRSIMSYALDKGYTDKKIGKLSLNKNLTVPNRDARFISSEMISEVLNLVSDNPRYKTLITLIVTSGVRQEEALALDIDDVKERDGGYYIHVYKANIKIEKNKYAIVDRLKHNEKPREIPIPKETYDMLHEYYNMTMSDKKFVQKKIDNGTERLIFVNVDGRVINKHTLYENFPKYIERKIKTNDKVRLHMLRHTYASLMCDDIPIEIVSEVLGHRDISITKQFYATTTDKQKQQIFNASTNLLNKINSYNN